MTVDGTFGGLIRRYRQAAELTQEALAERAGLSVREIRNLERGTRHRPRPDTLQLLLDALDVPPEEQESVWTAVRDGSAAEPVQVPVLQSTAVNTFLITDVRGYTRFTVERGDAEAARLATRFAELGEEVFSARGGRVVEIVGDQVFAVFSSTRQAFLAAAEFQGRLVMARDQDPSLPLNAGIGLDAGEAVPVKGGFRGAAVNLASRLCALAGPGEILVSESATHLARKMEGLSYVPRGLVELKGFADPVRVVEIVPEGTDRPNIETRRRHESLPLGAFLGALPRNDLVAREDEVERLTTLLDQVIKGHGQCALLGGGAGVGKTRLAQEVMLTAINQRFLVATARCYEDQGDVPFGPIRELLTAAVERAPQSLRLELLRRWPSLVALLPEGMVPAGARPEEELDQIRLFGAVAAFFAALADDMPVALLVDDLHWADADSLGIIQYLVRHTRTDRIFIVGTYRDTDLDAHPALLRLVRELGRDHLAERVPIRRFSPEGTAAMVAATVGEMEASDEFVEFVHRRTRGNPFYITKILQTLGGHYRLVREIGAGGMGRVFEAMDIRTGERVAAKLMLARSEADAHALERFQQEGQVLATLRHPNIVEVKGTFIDEHASCIIMELIRGVPLRQVMEDRQLSLDEIKHLAVQVADALASAHRQQVAHRDIKPDNIMVSSDDHVTVTDFGIARMLRPDVTMATMATTGMTLGTPHYMAPEQIQGRKVDGRADLYSLGAVLYQMITGRTLFEGEDALTIAVQHVQNEPVPPRKINPAIPAEWEALILRALAKDPAERFPNAAAMRDAIAALPAEWLDLAERQNRVSGRAAPRARRAIPMPAPSTRTAAWTGAIARLPWPGKLGAPVGAVLILGIILFSLHGSTAHVPGIGPAVRGWGTIIPTVQPLDYPTGIAVDRDGTIILVDQFNARIVRLTSAGAEIGEWGSQGSGRGQMQTPEGVAVDRTGDIYVADSANSRIEEFSPGGSVLHVWGRSGTEPGRFSSPNDVAVGSRGTLYVADTGNGRVQRLTAGAKGWTVWHPNLFEQPSAIAIGPNDAVYVADTGTNTVRRITASGQVSAPWGGGGITAGTFGAGSPAGLAVDSSGDVYAADQGNNRVEEFSPEGLFIRQWGEQGTGPGQFSSPIGVAVGPDGTVYAVDAGNNRVERLAPGTSRFLPWRLHLHLAPSLTQPSGITADARDNVYVTDQNSGAVDEYSPGGRLVASYHSFGAGIGKLSSSTGIAVDRQGDMFVVDGGSDRIVKILPSGAPDRSWSRATRGLGLNAPYGVAVARSGDVYITDAGHNRVVAVSPSGKQIASWGDEGSDTGQFTFPQGIAVDREGHVYVADSINNRVTEFTSKGRYLRTWKPTADGKGLRNPVGVAVDAEENLYIVDLGNNRVLKLSPNGDVISAAGERGQGPGQFKDPSSAAVDTAGNLYVTDTNNGRIQKFRPGA